MLSEVLVFIRQPTYREDPVKSFRYRLLVLVRLLLWLLVISFVLGMLIGVLTQAGLLRPGTHELFEFLQERALATVVLTVLILAPVLEEVLFRGPLWFFRKSRWFPLVLYLLTLVFGGIHLWNYTDFSRTWWLSPVLVAPQVVAGFFLAYIRVRFGLVWSIALHISYNAVLIAPFVLFRILKSGWS